MLKRIDPRDVELGMFIHQLEGSWFSHPFWKSRFLLDDPAQLARLRASRVAGVVIDTDRGRDVNAVSAPGPAPSPIQPDAAPRRATRTRAPVPEARPANPMAPRSIGREFGQASRIAERSKRAVSRLFFEVRLGKTIKPGLVEPVINDILASVQRNAHAFNGLMRCKRDSEHLFAHALATAALMITLGRRLRLPPDLLREAGMAGLLLDIGIGNLPVDLAQYHGDPHRIPRHILRDHAQLGHAMLQDGALPEAVATACLQHHERMDGTGYPAGLSGPAIGVLGRMAAICDAYDELVNASASEAPLDPAAAIARMQADAGAFDAAMLASFIEAMGIYPIGSVVQLRSGRLAMVVDQCPHDIARPTVSAFYSLVSGGMIAPETIPLANCFGEDAIEATVSPEAFGITDMAALRERLFVTACGGK